MRSRHGRPGPSQSRFAPTVRSVENSSRAGSDDRGPGRLAGEEGSCEPARNRPSPKRSRWSERSELHASNSSLRSRRSSHPRLRCGLETGDRPTSIIRAQDSTRPSSETKPSPGTAVPKNLDRGAASHTRCPRLGSPRSRVAWPCRERGPGSRSQRVTSPVTA